MTQVSDVLKSKLFTAVVVILIWLLLGTVVFRFFEEWSWAGAFYFSVVTLTTIGFGDFVPTSDLTRMLVSFYILGGVSVVLASLTIIGNTMIQIYQERLARENERLQKKVEVLSIIGMSEEKQYQLRLERENRHLRDIIKSIKSVLGKNMKLEEKHQIKDEK